MARHTLAAGLLLAVAALGVGPAAAITSDEFALRSGADVLALCSTPASDPLYTAAIHMCHGFGAGTYRTILALTARLGPVICPPDPSPSRNEVVRRFVEWGHANPGSLAEPAVDVLARFFMTQFPCGPK
jgi:hypothetical protein